MSADFWDTPEPAPPNPLRDDLMAMIVDRYRATPRHLQVALGPSQIAHPCMRKIALGLMAEPRTNPEFDPLASIIGTAMHSWLETAAQLANEILGRERWLTETRVHVAPELSGSSDLYDCDTQTVIDWKTASLARLKAYRKDPGIAFKTQVQLYGMGFSRAGLPVRRVALAFIPRAATLKSMHVWTDDYRPEVAQWAIDRRDQAIALCDDLQVEQHPERYAWIPAQVYDCNYCPWFAPRSSDPLCCKGDGS